jgi:2-polyprenyl-3-methyl-5-hydroxy-6-metoxy-1,4-benzoquinol methylase
MSCYLCNSANLATRSGTVRDAPEIRILECRGCGLVFLDSQAHINAEHYAQSGMHGATPPKFESWLRETATDDRRRFEFLRGELVNSRVLDFGCGAAGFVRLAADVAASVTGVELERRVHEHWNGSLNLLRSLEDAARDFDLITAFHVVEHLPDPRAVLTVLATHLAPGGRLVVEVPSSEDALLTLYANDPFQRFTYWSQHLYLFNTATLRQLAVQAGLSVVSIRQVQRYPLSNHLHWLSQGKPGGHQRWAFLDSPALASAYESALAAIGKCDTLVAFLERT